MDVAEFRYKLNYKEMTKIEKIKIKNVRGIKDLTIELNMIPNKPSILVAPNGSGKSSFATAFQWLNRLHLRMDEQDAYENDLNNKPMLSIGVEKDDGSSEELIANETTNQIGRMFDVFVINSGLKAKLPGMVNGQPMGHAYITTPEINIINRIPGTVELVDDFISTYSLSDAPQGTYPVINDLLNKNSFMGMLDPKRLKLTIRHINKIINFIEKTKGYEGTKAQRHERIKREQMDSIQTIETVNYAMDKIQHVSEGLSDVQCFLKAVSLLTFAYRYPDLVKDKIEYGKFKLKEDSTRMLFEGLRNTWLNIKPHRENGSLTLKMGDVHSISNGERDILVFLALLEKAKYSLNKDCNILVIDEVFDYLDDANLIAAQYYVSKFIEILKDQGKMVFPIILSHINPAYFKSFVFNDMKVYYLKAMPYPHASDNMKRLISKREELTRNHDTKGDAEMISKYMFHFHPDNSQDMSGIINMNNTSWGNVANFKVYCMEQTEAYLAVEQNPAQSRRYDSLAVCVALREMIEKYCYSKLANDDLKDQFLEEHRTKKKVEFAEENGVVVTETFCLLSPIYNQALHLDGKHQISLEQTFYSQLENNTIRSMIQWVKDQYDNL